jgi:hypothetical protein
VNYRSFMKAFETLRGKEAVEAMIVDLPEELADGLRYGRLVASGWYPVAWYRLMHASAQRVTKSGPELARAIGRQSRIDDFRSVYRLLSFVMSAEAVVAKGAMLYRLYDSMGLVDIQEARTGMLRVRFHNCIGYDANVWESSLGGTIGILESCGAEALRVQIVDRGRDGDDEMTFDARWV